MDYGTAWIIAGALVAQSLIVVAEKFLSNWLMRRSLGEVNRGVGVVTPSGRSPVHFTGNGHRIDVRIEEAKK